MKVEKWIEGISYYCRILYKTNQSIIKLADLNCVKEWTEVEDYFYEIAENIVTLIPCSANDKNVKLNKEDGIFDFIDELDFLETDIEKIFKDNQEIFHKIKMVRNKHEHVAHKIWIGFAGSGSTSLVHVTFEYENNTYELSCEEFIKIVQSVNILFDKIIEKFRKFKEDYDNNNEEPHPYLEKYADIKFGIFNNIYCSNVLRDCSRAMHNI